jgi:putative transposase
MPSRYYLDSSGKWRCPPGEEFASSFGLYYQVRTDAEVNWKLQKSPYFLSDYLSCNSSGLLSDAYVYGCGYLGLLPQKKRRVIPSSSIYNIVATLSIYDVITIT